MLRKRIIQVLTHPILRRWLGSYIMVRDLSEWTPMLLGFKVQGSKFKVVESCRVQDACYMVRCSKFKVETEAESS